MRIKLPPGSLKKKVFEGCMPVEEMASHGIGTLLFGPLKPVGLEHPETGKRPYAVVQLRQDNAAATLYNIVGFQTHLKWPEQRRVFGMIPGLEQAEFVRYGVMHRNTFIHSPETMRPTMQSGQMTAFFCRQYRCRGLCGIRFLRAGSRHQCGAGLPGKGSGGIPAGDGTWRSLPLYYYAGPEAFSADECEFWYHGTTHGADPGQEAEEAAAGRTGAGGPDGVQENTGLRKGVGKMENAFHATTSVAVRYRGKTAIAGDGQVTFGQNTIMKANARKVRRLYHGKVLSGFAGSVADAFTLFEKFEAKLEEFNGNLMRASVELAKEWRTDRVLRKLEALLLLADKNTLLMLSGAARSLNLTEKWQPSVPAVSTLCRQPELW